MKGFIKLFRDITEHWIWQDPQKLKWWLDLIMMANINDNKMLQGNKLVTIKRGSFHTSEVKLSERWGVSRRTVTNFLTLLQSDNMIRLEKSKNGTTVEVLNYKAYQDISTQKRATDDTTDDTTYYTDDDADSVADNVTDDVAQKKNVKNGKKEKNDKNGKEIKNILDAYAPSGELRECIDSFIKMRKDIKKPLTTTRALNTFLNKLDKLSAGDELTKIALIDQALERGWQTVYELKTDTRQQAFGRNEAVEDDVQATYRKMLEEME